ncbi:MAG: GHMP kinase [Methanomicrobiales archaeon]|nr:GHMP kinase [Methanomicrobiales archaeon]
MNEEETEDIATNSDISQATKRTYARAFCPGHISGYFMPVLGDDVVTSGSIGAGVVINEGVTVEVSPAKATNVTIIRDDPRTGLHQVTSGSPPVKTLLELCGVRASVTTWCHLPIGAGFGLSAAAVMATATSVDAVFSLGIGEERCAELAHHAEVVNRTGLGDATACQGGGRDCRKSAGIHAPVIRSFDMDEPLLALSFADLPSPSVLSSPDTLARVTRAYPGRCPRDPYDLMALSRRFAEDSGLIPPEVRTVLTACDRSAVMASMTMLGCGVFAYGDGAQAVLEPFGTLYSLSVATEGPRLLDHREVVR